MVEPGRGSVVVRLTGDAAESLDPTGPIGAIRATAHRLVLLAADVPTVVHEADGWTRLADADATATDAEVKNDGDGHSTGGEGRGRSGLLALSVAARVPACRLGFDDNGLWVVAYGPDGSVVGPLDAGCTEADAMSAVTVFGLPDGAPLLFRALTSASTSYDGPARIADACRCLGLPLELLTPAGPVPDTVVGAPPAGPEVGVVLVYAPAVVAAAEAPLTRQSAWTVPVDPLRCVQLWDGRGARANLPVAAEVLANRRWPTLAYWWSERTAGFVLTRRNRVAGAHEWGGGAPATPEGTARAGRQLAEAFGVPERALSVVGLLRRTDLPPGEALTELGRLLDVPMEMVGRTAAELTEWAESVPGAIRTERLSFLGALLHSVREHPMRPPREDLYHVRPRWQRLLSGLTLLAIAPITVFATVGWLHGEMSGWWVLLGLVLCGDMAWGVRPGRRSRMRVNRGTTPIDGQ